ncbi:MAG TPA: ABC transporter substrate-binding protein, partial [Limnobacter sp.]|nr:ABC transporter substrate-binding protein [Limnobacter sp.]
FIPCMGGNRCLKNMLDGQTDLATVAEFPVVLTSFSRSDYAVLSTFVTASNNVKVIVRSSRKVVEPSQLRNLKVGYIKGGTSHYMLDLLLVYSGVDPKTVDMKPLTADNALVALRNGEVDAVSIWEPYASRILLEMKNEVSPLSTPKLYTETFNLVALQSAIRTRPQDLQNVIAALKDSNEYIRANPDKAEAVIADRFDLPSATIRRIMSDYRFNLSLNRALLRTMEGQARWAIREGHASGNTEQPNLGGYLYPVLLRRVDAAAVSLP